MKASKMRQLAEINSDYWVKKTIELMQNDAKTGLYEGKYFLGNIANVEEISKLGYVVESIQGDTAYVLIKW